jgi:hypothetical protein
MNLENLSTGLIVNNYKEMCKLLGEDVKFGNSKKYQLKEWQCYFNFEKQGNAFVITEIFSKPKPKVDERVENSVYTKLIELMLMYELSQKPNHTCHYTKTFLFYQLGMINETFFKNKDWENYTLLDNNNIKHWQFDNFYARTQNKLTKVLFSALNSMKRRKLLDYEEKRVIIELDKKVNFENPENNYRYATKDEKEFILALERDILTKMGYNKVPFQYTKRKEYYNEVSRNLAEQFGWRSYKEYELIYHIQHLKDGISEVKCEIYDLLKSCQLELNSKIMNFLNNEAEKKYLDNCEAFQKHSDKVMENFLGEPTDYALKKGFFQLPVDYVEKQNLLADIFINIQD